MAQVRTDKFAKFSIFLAELLAKLNFKNGVIHGVFQPFFKEAGKRKKNVRFQKLFLATVIMNFNLIRMSRRWIIYI